MRSLLILAFTVAVLAPAYSQTTCNANAVPNIINANGGSELTSDLLLICTSTGASVSANVNFQIFLNVNLTSRIMNPITMDTESMLLIDEPQPGVANTSNSFPYFGQVLGTSGVPAGMPGSGNVYQAKQLLNNTAVWASVPFVTGPTRTFRFTNIRANSSLLGGGGSIHSFLAIAGSLPVVINNPDTIVAFTTNGLTFSSATPPGALDLHFTEAFASAFLKRIENTLGGPLTASHQDIPGTVYCTESGFTPEFSAVTPGAIGSANTGTRLLTRITNIPPGVFVLIVPNEVTSSSGQLVAHRVLPPLGANFAAGTVTLAGGFGIEFVTSAHTADLLYEVTAASPFLGTNGCTVIESFSVHAFTFFPISMASAIVKGHLAPVDATAVASSTAPEPRFVP